MPGPARFIIGEEFIGDDDVALVLGDNLFHGTDLGTNLPKHTEIDGAVVFACNSPSIRSAGRQQVAGSPCSARVSNPTATTCVTPPRLTIAAQLASLGAAVAITDPQAIENARRRFPELHHTRSTDEALHGAELVLVLTEWRQFRELEPTHAVSLVSNATAPIVIDGRNCIDAEARRAAGWHYLGLGR